MTFGEKLYKLRKENGLSQEALAEKLNTSRQAVSKWENGQGYPETEKLLMIGNIFGVSMDYLLKDKGDTPREKEEGYYVSKEMAEGYLVNIHKVAKYFSFGLFFIALAFIPYFLFNEDSSMFLIPTIILATIGFGVSVSAGLLEEDQYKVLKQEPLLLDEQYVKELTVRYERLKRKYRAILLIGISFFVAGMISFGIDRKFIDSSDILTPYYPIFIAFIAVGIYMISFSGSILDGYYLLVKNEEHANKFGFKIRRKFRRKIDEL